MQSNSCTLQLALLSTVYGEQSDLHVRKLRVFQVPAAFEFPDTKLSVFVQSCISTILH